MMDEHTTQTIELTAEEDRTHALLCALTRAKRRAKDGKGPRAEEYLEHYESLQQEVSDIHFHDRRKEEDASP